MNSLFSLALRILLVPELFLLVLKNLKKKFPDLALSSSDLLDLFLIFLIYSSILRSRFSIEMDYSSLQELNDRFFLGSETEEVFSSIQYPVIGIPDRNINPTATILCSCGRIARVLMSCKEEKFRSDLQFGGELRTQLEAMEEVTEHGSAAILRCKVSDESEMSSKSKMSLSGKNNCRSVLKKPNISNKNPSSRRPAVRRVCLISGTFSDSYCLIVDNMVFEDGNSCVDIAVESNSVKCCPYTVDYRDDWADCMMIKLVISYVSMILAAKLKRLNWKLNFCDELVSKDRGYEGYLGVIAKKGRGLVWDGDKMVDTSIVMKEKWMLQESLVNGGYPFLDCRSNIGSGDGIFYNKRSKKQNRRRSVQNKSLNGINSYSVCCDSLVDGADGSSGCPLSATMEP